MGTSASRPENIPNLTVVSTTSVSIATTNAGQSTRINVGGQQYIPSSTLTLSTAGTGANGLDTGALGAIQLWYVYAIAHQTTFALALVASLNAPSSGPTMPSGYGTVYRLVGAFYTNGSSQVGSAVPISGTITTDWMTYSPSVSNLGTGGVTTSTAKWRRNGDSIQVYFKWTKDGSAGTGSSFVLTQMPSGLSYDTSKMYNASAGDNRFGNLLQLTGGVFNNKWSIQVRSPVGTNGVVFVLDAASDDLVGSGVPANSSWYGDFVLPVSGWNSTLL
jgi:hypothetical protein